MAKHADDAKLVLREVRLMRLLGGHLNVISMLDLIVRDASDEMYIGSLLIYVFVFIFIREVV
jgi:hypothetical protein